MLLCFRGKDEVLMRRRIIQLNRFSFYEGIFVCCILMHHTNSIRDFLRKITEIFLFGVVANVSNWVGTFMLFYWNFRLCSYHLFLYFLRYYLTKMKWTVISSIVSTLFVLRLYHSYPESISERIKSTSRYETKTQSQTSAAIIGHSFSHTI